MEKEKNQKRQYKLVVRYIPGFYGTQPVPEGLSEEEALEHAREVARKFKKRCCLSRAANSPSLA